MKDWQFTIGEWVVINDGVKNDSSSDVGKLAYIKELRTSNTYDYRVVTHKNEELNVRESELNPIPKDKLDYYLEVRRWKRVRHKQYKEECKVLSLDFLREKAHLENTYGYRYLHDFNNLEEIKGDEGMSVNYSSFPETKVVDNVNKPNHYTQGGIETLEYMKAKMKEEAFHGFLTGNVIKYISRFEFKNGVEDLKKARVYLDRLIREKESKLNQ